MKYTDIVSQLKVHLNEQEYDYTDYDASIVSDKDCILLNFIKKNSPPPPPPFNLHPNFYVVHSYFNNLANHNYRSPMKISKPRLYDKNCIQVQYTFKYDTHLFFNRIVEDCNDYHSKAHYEIHFKNNNNSNNMKNSILMEAKFIINESELLCNKKTDDNIEYKDRFLNTTPLYNKHRICLNLLNVAYDNHDYFIE